MKNLNMGSFLKYCLSAFSFTAMSVSAANDLTVSGWWGVDTTIMSSVSSAPNATRLDIHLNENAIFKIKRDESTAAPSNVVLTKPAASFLKWETGSDGVTPALRFHGKGHNVEIYYIVGKGKDTIACAKQASLENLLWLPDRTLVGAFPRRIIDSKESGSVKVDIIVTKAGYVEGVSILNSKGITNPHVRNEILSDALHLRFSTSSTDGQHGAVVYNISADDYNEALALQKKQEREERHRLQAQERIHQKANSKVANAFSNLANSYELDGRTLAKAMPTPKCTSTVNGWIEINVTVDNDGNVTKATLGRRSKDMTDQAVFDAAIAAAKETKFNKVNRTDMPNQLGIITYHISAK